MKKQYKILFIGNSYTYFNDMPTAIFQRLATSAGYEVSVTAITKGGYKLRQHADIAKEHGAKVDAALNGEPSYDYVVLQEQSVLPATEDAHDFHEAVRNFAERIRKTGAQPILYATWGRKTGNSTLDTYGWTNESMTWRLASSYQAIGDELKIPVAHVGLAFFDVYTHHEEIELYDPDKTHPSYSGSYLAAATLLAKIFSLDPTALTDNGDLTAPEAELLRQAAKSAVWETPAIPNT